MRAGDGLDDFVVADLDKRRVSYFQRMAGAGQYERITLARNRDNLVDVDLADLDGTARPPIASGQGQEMPSRIHSRIACLGGAGDGHLDVIISQSTGRVSAMMKASDGEAAAELVLRSASADGSSPLVAVALADVFQSGFPSLLLAYSDGLILTFAQVELGNPASYELLAGSSSAGPALAELHALDMDGDLDIDLLTRSSSGPLLHDNSCCGDSGPTPAPSECVPEFQVFMDSEVPGQAQVSGTWATTSVTGGRGSSVLLSNGVRNSNTFVEFDLTEFPRGLYQLEASYVPSPDRATVVTYQIRRNGVVTSTAQLDHSAILDTPPFAPLLGLGDVHVNRRDTVVLRVSTIDSSPGNVVADAIKVVRCGRLDTSSSSSPEPSTST